MDIVSSFNPPRLVYLAGERYQCRALTLEDLAIVAAWLDDVLPGWVDRKLPPAFGSPEASEALGSDEGRALMAWAGLRHEGLSFDRVAHLLSKAGDAEKTWLSVVLARRRRTLRPGGMGDDLFHAWFGPNVATMAERFGLSPAEVGRLSLDQYAMLCSDGCPDERPDAIDLDELQAQWGRHHAEWLARQEGGATDE